MSFAMRVRASRHNTHLITARDETGLDCYYVLDCPRYKLDLILRNTAEIVNLEDHAKIVDSGYGKPPKTLLEQLGG